MVELFTPYSTEAEGGGYSNGTRDKNKRQGKTARVSFVIHQYAYIHMYTCLYRDANKPARSRTKTLDGQNNKLSRASRSGTAMCRPLPLHAPGRCKYSTTHPRPPLDDMPTRPACGPFPTYSITTSFSRWREHHHRYARQPQQRWHLGGRRCVLHFRCSSSPRRCRCPRFD